MLPTLHALDQLDFQPVVLAPAGDEPDTADPSLSDVEGRYEDLGLLGIGAMGEVRRVRDRELNRTLAMKSVHPRVLLQPRVLARFVEEAQATAQLQHPNILPVHDIGVFADGRVWFTMREVRGRPLSEVIARVHAASGDSSGSGTEGWTFRRLVGAYQQICQAVAYAHSRGVLHRDLKPENVMVGTHGEVYVVDWGLAKVVGRPDPDGDDALEAVVTDRTLRGGQTRAGTVSGTPIYMSPEQARGEVERVDVRSDVYGLGVVLYEILVGRGPFDEEDIVRIIARVAAGATDPIDPSPQLPPELVAACERAMAVDPEARFQTAEDLAREIGAWLDGARRREQALALVEGAMEQVGEVVALREQAASLEQEARVVLSRVPRWAEEGDKATGWALEDAALGLREQSARVEQAIERGLHGALRIDPELPEAHAALAERALASHRAAESGRDPGAARRAETAARDHQAHLPEDHPVARRCAAYLRGTGALSLQLDAEGATVELCRFETRNRRLVPVHVRHLGEAPLVEIPLERGSWLCILRHPERETVRYPVVIGRGEHWHGRPPGSDAAQPVHLPPRGSLGPDEIYVPAGWFRSGGDPGATDPLPDRALWCDGLVVDRHPVTNARYVAFLNDLLERGREAEALEVAPRQPGAMKGERGPLLLQRDERGRFVLGRDPDGDEWLPDAPVLAVHFGCAVAFARWRAEKAGQPWRLPAELEWEKASRGVDGRWYPWGDYLDPSWCCHRQSHRGRPLPQVVSRFPVDRSVYGVRGTAGNVRDWCGERWDRDGPSLDGERVRPAPLPDELDLDSNALRVLRGGNWAGIGRQARCANRHGHEPSQRLPSIGFRTLRSI